MELFPWDSFHCTQSSRHSEAATTMMQGSQPLLKLVTDLVHMMLVLPHAKCKSYCAKEAFVQISKKKLEAWQGAVHEAVGMKLKVQWRTWLLSEMPGMWDIY